MPGTMRIFVYGAGKVGGYTACLLGQNHYAHITVHCRSNYDSVVASGFKFMTKDGNEKVFQPQAVVRRIPNIAHDLYDYVVCANKVVSIDGSCWIPTIMPLMSPGTTLVLCQNGLPENDALQAFPNNPIITAIYQNNLDERPSGALAEVATLQEKGFTLGCFCRSQKDMRALKRFASLDRDNLLIADNIVQKRWTKLAFNITLCYSAALYRRESQELRKSSAAQTTMRSLAQETATMAAPHGVEISPNLFESLMATVDRLPSFAPSMLQDMRETGTPIKVDMFAGQLKHMADVVGIKTPMLDEVWESLSVE